MSLAFPVPSVVSMLGLTEVATIGFLMESIRLRNSPSYAMLLHLDNLMMTCGG
jgi:hypothetical protein